MPSSSSNSSIYYPPSSSSSGYQPPISSSSSLNSSESPPPSSSSNQSSGSSSSGDPCNGNTFQVRERITDLPIVATNQNGTGLQYRKRDVFDTFGRLIWSMDPRGYITRNIYDPATSALIRRIDDVDTDEVSGAPTGWSTPADGGLNLVTDYETDSQGRRLRELGPAHEAQLRVDDCTIEVVWLRTVQFSVYRDDIREMWSASGYARGFGPNYTYVTVGSVRIDRRNYNGQTIDQIEAIRSCACGPLSSDESFPQKNWRRWTHHLYNQWGQLQGTRVYHKIPESGDGDEGTNYNETRYGYDVFGRQNKVVSPGGTITRTVFDSQDRPIQQWVGTNDAGATDDEPHPTGAPASNNMVEVKSNEFDGGVGGGDGNLTQDTRYIGASGSDRVTNFSYDFRNRLEDTEQSDGSSTFLTRNLYDNRNQVTGVDTYHTSVTAGNLTGRTRSYFDSQGRPFKTENYAVDPNTGTVGNALTGEQWFDASGNLVKSTQPGSEAITAFGYDSLGRQTMRYLAYATPISSSSSGSSNSSPLFSGEAANNAANSLNQSSSSSGSYMPPIGSSSSSSSEVGNSSESSSSYHPNSSASSVSSTDSIDSSSSLIPGPTQRVSCQPCQGNSNCGCATPEEQECVVTISEYPIMMATGEILLAENDLGSTAFGSLWGQTRSYSNRLDPTSDGDNGNAWLISQLAYLQFDAGESGQNIVVIRGTNDSIWFEPDGSGGWKPQFVDRDQLYHDTVNLQFILTFESGRQMIFYDNDASHPEDLRGALKSFADEYGLSVELEFNGQNQVSRVHQTDGTQSITYLYAYETSGGNIGMLQSVTLQVNGADVRKAVYDYYADGDDGGGLNDLRRVSIGEYDATTDAWETLRQFLYWYYTSNTGVGFAHGLRFEVRPENYARMVDSGIDPLSADSETIASYADKAFEYDANQHVTKETVRGGEESFTYSYRFNTGDDPGFDDQNIWYSRTIETRIDEATQTVYSTRTVYANKAGLTLLDKQWQPDTTVEETEKTWYTYYELNDDGRVVTHAYPSAIQSVSEPDPDMGNYTLTVTLKTDAGLIKVNSYYASTNVEQGEIASYLDYTGVKEGSGGTVSVTESYTWDTHTVDGVTIYPRATTTTYPVAGQSGDTTTYHYCWYDTENSSMGYFGYLPINSDNLGDVSNLTVVEQDQTTYDDASQAIQATNWQRFDDATGFGPLNGPNDSQPKARRSYMANWYDGVGRNVASANFGTCGGAVLIRPDVSPERSDTVLVSSTRYKDDGEANATIDPMGVETRWQNDHAGRRIRLIENYSPCGNEPDTNRITEYDYAPDGGLSRLTLINDVTGDQMTRWVYGTTTDDSEIARSDLLRAKIYPESDDTSSPLGDGTDGVYERIEYGYNRQGQVIYMKDPNETTHAYGYDDLGRQIEDQITAFGTGIDQGIATLGTTYDTKRLLRTKVTSYDGADAVANEVGFTYDDFGQLASDQQEHEGAVDGSTLEVQYAYEDGTRANTSRRTSMTYPDGRLLNYGFGTNDEANDLLSRVESLQIQGEAFELCSYTYVGAARYVKIAYAQPGVQLSYIKTSGSPLGDAGDPYNGYDRFGRTVEMRWVTTSGGAVRDRIQYGYDRANNRTWRRNLAATDGGQDNAYGYDGLYQVKQAALGTLNLNQTAIGSIPAEDELFDYDPTGNWTHYNRSADGNGVLDQSRISNQDNQLTQIDGSSNGIAYDKAGNATKLPPDVDGDWAEFYQLAWDGWNRLVEIKDSDAATVASYAYDGIFRRITKTLGVETRHYYYNDLWKCIEERVPTSSSSSSNPSSSLSSMSPGSSISSLGPGSSGSGFSSYIPGSSGSAFFAPAFASFVLTSPDQVEVQYVWGARPQHRDELVLRDRDSNGDGSLDERLYCLMDYFNPTSAIDTSGNVVERYRFSAYGLRSVMDGNWVERSQSNYDFKLAFQGQFRDEESGYYDYGFRYYAPSLGRWLTKDPIEEKGGQNIYGLTANNAVNAVDFLGLIGGVVPLGGGGWANPWTGEVHPVSPPGPPPWEEVEGDDGSTHAKVNKCNIVVFFGHNGLVPQGTIENDQCSAATVVACGGGINNTNPGVPQNPVPGAPRTPDDQGLNMGNEFAAFEASWQAAKEHAKTLCNEPPDCCSRIKVSVDCSGLHWYQHSSWTSIYGSVCETRPHYEYCRS